MDRFMVGSAVANETESVHRPLHLGPSLPGVATSTRKTQVKRWDPQAGEVLTGRHVAPEPERQLGNDLPMNLGVAPMAGLLRRWLALCRLPPVECLVKTPERSLAKAKSPGLRLSQPSV